jgi:hypothetical protein
MRYSVRLSLDCLSHCGKEAFEYGLSYKKLINIYETTRGEGDTGMIYLDNAATTLKKQARVERASYIRFALARMPEEADTARLCCRQILCINVVNRLLSLFECEDTERGCVYNERHTRF